MEKPITMSIKEFIIRSMSTTLMIPEKTINAVIDHQFLGVSSAMKKHTIALKYLDLESFYLIQRKLKKRMEKFVSQKNLFEERMNDETLF